jgi:hypothetical protein
MMAEAQTRTAARLSGLGVVMVPLLTLVVVAACNGSLGSNRPNVAETSVTDEGSYESNRGVRNNRSFRSNRIFETRLVPPHLEYGGRSSQPSVAESRCGPPQEVMEVFRCIPDTLPGVRYVEGPKSLLFRMICRNGTVATFQLAVVVRVAALVEVSAGRDYRKRWFHSLHAERYQRQ